MCQEMINRKYPCTFKGCNKRYSRPAHVRRHMLVHLDQRDHCCSFPGCEASFRLPHHLTRHLKTHTDFPFHCPEENCFERFHKKRELRSHLKKEHPIVETEKKFLCAFLKETEDYDNTNSDDKNSSKNFDICGQLFMTLEELNEHTKKEHQDQNSEEDSEEESGEEVEDSEENISETETEEELVKEGNKKRKRKPIEESTEEEKKSDKQTESGQESKQSSQLSKNSEKKTKKKKRNQKTQNEHQCPLCFKMMSSEDWLRRHVRLHDPNREFFTCPLCNDNRTFSNRGNLNIHLKMVHEGFRRFTCEICSQGFMSKPRLLKHVELHKQNKIGQTPRSRKPSTTFRPANILGVLPEIPFLSSSSSPPLDSSQSG